MTESKATKSKVTIIGSGFSGLVCGYFLVKKGFSVRFMEASDRAGGLLGSYQTDFGLVETAANGILNTALLEQLCADLKVNLLRPKKENKKRYIYRGKARSVPINLSEFPKLFSVLGKMLLRRKSLQPKEQESIRDWGQRVLGQKLTLNVLEPALQGIYGGSTGELSAHLIFGGVFKKKKANKVKVKGTVSFSGGMQELINALVKFHKEVGSEFQFNQDVQFVDQDELCVIATNLQVASRLVRGVYPDLSKKMERVDVMPVVSCTVFFNPHIKQLKGFGCLLPEKDRFSSLGVLFNSDIFAGRSQVRSETYILPGAYLDSSDESIEFAILKDRKRFQGLDEKPLKTVVTRWEKALPRYDFELLKVSKDFEAIEGPCFLMGNYINGIGLSKILRNASELADRIERKHSEASTTDN